MFDSKTVSKRAQGRANQRLRQRLFSKQPLCVSCLAKGIFTLATQRDHIVALTNGGTETEDNTQPLCVDCHRIKSALDLGKNPKKTIGIDGWPEP